MFKFDLEDYRASCLTLQGIQKNGLTLVEDTSGSVFLFDSENRSITYRINTKPCCEALGYNFDIVNQKCLWKTESEGKNDFKIILNPEGNHGTLFNINENQTCCLDVSFDYMFKFDCAELIEATSETTTTVSNVNEEVVTKLTETVRENEILITRYKELIVELEKTPYVVECNESSPSIGSFGEDIKLYDGAKIKSAYINDDIKG
jgi:hypothetical protein